MIMSSKQLQNVWFLLSNSSLGSLKKHLDLGPTPKRQVLKSTYVHKSLPGILTLVTPKRQFKNFVFMPSDCVEM